MKVRTFFSLLRSGQLTLAMGLSREVKRYERLTFLAAGLSSGVLRRIAPAPVPLDVLASEFCPDAAMRDGFFAWLELGVALRVLRKTEAGFALHGTWARKLASVEFDALAAYVEGLPELYVPLIHEAPQRWRTGHSLTLADQDGGQTARASRLAEPFIFEVLDDIVPRRGPLRLLDVGCGAGTLLRHAAGRNAELTAVGFELQDDVAAQATAAVAGWNLASRVEIVAGDILAREGDAAFDVVTLNQVIHYFPVPERMRVLRHLRGFLKPGGRLLLTNLFQGPGTAVGTLNLWSAMTKGCGPLPSVDELSAQLSEAGFSNLQHRSLIPGESFRAIIATARGAIA